MHKKFIQNLILICNDVFDNIKLLALNVIHNYFKILKLF
jgi:hypothetical protein